MGPAASQARDNPGWRAAAATGQIEEGFAPVGRGAPGNGAQPAWLLWGVPQFGRILEEGEFQPCRPCASILSVRLKWALSVPIIHPTKVLKDWILP